MIQFYCFIQIDKVLYILLIYIDFTNILPHTENAAIYWWTKKCIILVHSAVLFKQGHRLGLLFNVGVGSSDRVFHTVTASLWQCILKHLLHSCS